MNCVLFAKMDQVFSKENKTLKKYWKIGTKYWKSQGILSVQNPDQMNIKRPAYEKFAYSKHPFTTSRSPLHKIHSKQC